MQPLPSPEPMVRRRTRPGSELYACAGDRAYLVGAQDGDFPPVGRHVPGEMGGLWAHPIKLLDGFWFRVGGQQLAGPEQFTTYPWGCEMEYELAGGGVYEVSGTRPGWEVRVCLPGGDRRRLAVVAGG